MADTFTFQCVIGAILAAGSLVLPESPRWLIDTDKDDEGLRILADLHGGDLNNVVARAEYQEIKDKVIMEVRTSRLNNLSLIRTLVERIR